MNTITVKFFSLLKEKVGATSINIDIAEGATIAELKKQLTQQFPSLETLLTNILILINNKVAINEDIIPKNCTVSFMPPIGGG